jgi:hypothetical protein
MGVFGGFKCGFMVSVADDTEPGALATGSFVICHLCKCYCKYNRLLDVKESATREMKWQMKNVQ